MMLSRAFVWAFLFISSITVASTTFAVPTTVGNGGTGIACYDSNGKLASVRLLDLWEAEILDGVTPGISISNYRTQVRAQAKILAKLLHSDPYYSELTEETLGKIQLLRPGARLQLTGDVNTVLAPSLGCEYVQIANHTNTGRLFVVGDFWDRLDEMNRAALITHETLYLFMRIWDERNSDRIRRTVALLFSGYPLKEKIEWSGKRWASCETDVTRPPVTRFMIHEEGGQVKFEFGLLLGRLAIDRISFGVKTQANGENGPAFSSLDGFLNHRYFVLKEKLVSDIDRDVTMILDKSGNQNEYDIELSDLNSGESFHGSVSCSWRL
jgi:hypothetical protein